MEVMAVIAGANVTKLSSFNLQFGTSFTILADPGRIVRGRRYRTVGNPSVVIIDKEGIVRYSGGYTNARAMEKEIESIRNSAGS